jgi:hypothetical protein
MTQLPQIKCCLDEWSSGQRKTKTFSSSSYSSTYRGTLQLIEQLEGDPLHAAKFLAMRKQWAQRGVMETGNEDVDDEEYSGFQIHLD